MTYPLSASFCAKFHSPKPPLPYLTGQKLVLRSHTPPSPTVGSCALNPITANERESKHPLERCLLHPPLPGSDRRHAVLMEITATIRVGDDQCAQLAAVQVLNVTPTTIHGLPTNQTLVAKLYDPLYFDHEQDDADPFLCVDRDYSHETAAYTALSKLQGTVIPKYYGSYSLEIPVDATNKRFVRLILIESIPGTSMQQLDPVGFSQLERQIIMKAVIDAESLIYAHDVQHKDIHPRNIIVLGNFEPSHSRKVVLIDFGKSIVGRSRFPEDPMEERQYLQGIPITPLLRWNEAWWPYLQTSFGAWIDWDWQPWLGYNYASTSASITEKMRSVWLPAFLTSPPHKPPGFS